MLRKQSVRLNTVHACMVCCRAALAASVHGTVFFAGEATHKAVNPCLQAAFETGEQAAKDILASPIMSRL